MQKSDLDNIFAPLPNTEAQNVAEKYDLLHTITNNLSADCRRHYQKKSLLSQDRLCHNILIKYFKQIQQYDIMNNNLESFLVPTELDRLNIKYIKIDSCIYYFFNNGKNLFPLFCEDDFQNLYSTEILSPISKIQNEELLALIYWHKNKTLALSPAPEEWCTYYHPSAMAMKVTALCIIQSYQVKIDKSANSITDNISKQDLLNLASKSLHIAYLGDNCRSILNYTQKLLTSVSNHISQEVPCSLLQFLWNISYGNIVSLASFHNMIVSSILGLDFIHYSHLQELKSFPKTNFTIICCPSPDIYAKVLKTIFDATMPIRSSNDSILSYNIRNFSQSRIYREYSPAMLQNSLHTPSIIKDELCGTLINISIEKDKSDLGNLMKFVQGVIKYKDAIGQDIKYHPTIQLIHFMSKLPTDRTLYSNCRVIELTGDLSGKNISLSSSSCMDLLLLSLYWALLSDQHIPGQDGTHNIGYTEEAAINYFIDHFFTNTTNEISKDNIDKATQNGDLSNSKYDDERKKIAESLDIVKLPYTIRDDVNTAYNKWRESDPSKIPTIKSPADKVRMHFPAIFYVKQTKLKSKFNTSERKESNCKALFGLELDIGALDEVISGAQKNVNFRNNIQNDEIKDHFLQVYQSMRDTFLEKNPTILNNLTEILMPMR
jgi:hypothetical protein